MKINVSHLILEVTRKCNMCCDHCLRGNAQAKDMTKEMVDTILSNIDNIGTVTFTGGEPTLNLDIIRYFFEKAEEIGKLPSAFWIATNGKAYQLELANLLLQYYPKMDEPDACGVAVSADIFHEEPEFNFLRELKFYDSSKEHSSEDIEKWVMKSGRAEEYGFGEEKLLDHRSTELYFETYKDSIDFEEIYVNVNGDIIPHCDYSFEEQEEMKICHITNFETHFSKEMENAA